MFTFNQIIRASNIMKAQAGNAGARIVRMSVPISYRPHCNASAPNGQTIRRHMEVEQRLDATPDLGMWDLVVTHIQNRTEGDATTRDLLGQHQVWVCSQCHFVSSKEGGVKKHIAHCKKHNSVEVRATMSPEIEPGIEGTGRQDQEEGDEPEDIPTCHPKMNVKQLNELGRVWL
jgi:hypothetical protein